MSDVPAVSVVIRSYNRLDACIELIECVLRQQYPQFEVIVVEQSTSKSDEQMRRLDELRARNPNLRILSRPPLGPSGARNEGCRNANNEILLFIDDDDIPISEHWIRQHVENYADPDVLGVSGGDVLSPDEDPRVCPYKNPARARRRNVSYSAFGIPRCYPRLRERVDGIEWLRGGNSSIRRSVVAEVGGWDEDAVDHEEHSFAFRLRPLLAAGKRLVFDPRPIILRRNHLSGGLERRNVGPFVSFKRNFIYFHRIYARYHRAKFVALYPVYSFVITWMTAERAWDRSDRTLGSRVRDVATTLLASPVWFSMAWSELLRSGPSKASLNRVDAGQIERVGR